MKIYISGAITGTDDYMERFQKAEDFLADFSRFVINPAKINANMPKDTTWDEYMKISMCLLEMCDAIFMIDGWEKSRGANREYGYAKGRGMQILRSDWKEGVACEC